MNESIFNKFYPMIFSRPSLYKFHKKLWAIGCRGMGFMNHNGYRVTGEFNAIKTIKNKIDTDSPIIFDVGANHGTWSKMARDTFPLATIHSFEPVKELFNNLRGNFHKYNLAIGDKREKVEIYYNDELKGCILEEVGDSSETVNVETIDNFCIDSGIMHIDFLKMDIEGYEYKALMGARKMIDKRAIDFIQFEFAIEGDETLKDFQKLLKDYVFYRLLPNGFKKINYEDAEESMFLMQNILAVRSNYNYKYLITEIFK